MDANIIWRDIKNIRANYIRKLPDDIKDCKTTISRENFRDILKPNVKKIMTKKPNSTENIGNLSKEIGAEMFLLLNLCPSFYARLYRKVIYKGEINPAPVLTNKNTKVQDCPKTFIFIKNSFAVGATIISGKVDNF